MQMHCEFWTIFWIIEITVDGFRIEQPHFILTCWIYSFQQMYRFERMVRRKTTKQNKKRFTVQFVIMCVLCSRSRWQCVNAALCLLVSAIYENMGTKALPVCCNCIYYSNRFKLFYKQVSVHQVGLLTTSLLVSKQLKPAFVSFEVNVHERDVAMEWNLNKTSLSSLSTVMCALRMRWRYFFIRGLSSFLNTQCVCCPIQCLDLFLSFRVFNVVD